MLRPEIRYTTDRESDVKQWVFWSSIRYSLHCLFFLSLFSLSLSLMREIFTIDWSLQASYLSVLAHPKRISPRSCSKRKWHACCATNQTIACALMNVVLPWSDLRVTPFYSVLVSVSVFMALSTVFHSINSPNNSLLSHSVLPVLFLPYWSFQLYLFMKIFPSPDCGWLGPEHQLTN